MRRRTAMTTTLAPFLLPALAVLCLGAGAVLAESPLSWTLPKPSDVELGGPLGEAYGRGVARLGEDPYKSDVYLRSDLSFEVKRPFTNFSGDISGRFLEVASMTSPPGKMEPAALAGLIEAVPRYQLADGHFGREIDWSKPIDDPPLCMTDKATRLPALWGHARLLVGLLEAYTTYHDPKYLKAAQGLGDFYLNTAGVLLDPAREEQYRSTGSYSAAYVTCYFPAMEGLVRLAQVTKDDRYLKHAERMAEFFPRFDKLPLDHSHGNLISYHGLLLLHEATGKQEYLDRAVARWKEALDGGYIWPIGGVGENFKTTSHYDEGCSEADWLRMNLDLWRITGQTRFLDTAERHLLNHYAMNRMANGGYGHHVFVSDSDGPQFMKAEQVEAVWCCTFHGLMGMNTLKRYVVVGSPRGIFVNFPLDVTAPAQVGSAVWNVTVRRQAASDQAVVCQVRIDPREAATGEPKVFVRRPDWAESVQVTDTQGKAVEAACEAGYVSLPVRPGADGALTVAFAFAPRVENRRMQRQTLDATRITRHRGVVLGNGPRVLLANAEQPRPTIVLAMDKEGRLVLPKSDGGLHRVATVASVDAPEDQVQAALKAPGAVALTPWEGIHADQGAAFVFDLIVVPQGQ
jgi:rhamnogalacturonyl hydrolase YesR